MYSANELDFRNSDLQRLHAFLNKNRGRELVAVFDIGTKAARVLVGFKKVPLTDSTWVPDSFFNAGQVFNLGEDFNQFNRVVNIEQSPALKGVILFIKKYNNTLIAAGLNPANIVIVGTAVFRWMKNRLEVIEKIQKETGLLLKVITHKAEAFYSSLAVFHTRDFGKEKIKTDSGFDENDVFLLFDQGGGSIEISYFHPVNISKGNQDSLNELGTVALQENFFSLGGTKIDPSKNQTKISTQFERINAFVDENVNAWTGFPELSGEKYRFYAFGMGTAISACFRGGSQFGLNNRLLSIERMEGLLRDYADGLEKRSGQVRTLYREVKGHRGEHVERLEKQLLLLYGLPVYIKLLRKFNLNEVRYCSFGLRYGVYIACFQYGIDPLIDDNPLIPIVIEKQSSDSQKIIQDSPPKIFISYAHEDESHNRWVLELSNRLREKYGIDAEMDMYNKYGADPRVWIEEKIEWADKVIMICTPGYGKKSQKRQGLRGFELVQILQKLYLKYSENGKFITVLRNGNHEESIPAALQSLIWVDMVDDSKYEKNIAELLKAICDKAPHEKPPLGK